MSTPDLPPSFTHADARSLGLSERRLSALVASGVVHRIGRGVFRRADAAVADEGLIEVAIRAPDATLCLLSALHYHALTDHIPARIDAALPRSRRAPALAAAVRWHRFDESTYEIGRELINVGDGRMVGLYTPERTIVDAFRLRHLHGDDLAVEALKRWLRRPGSAASALLSLARSFPVVEPALTATLQVLL